MPKTPASLSACAWPRPRRAQRNFADAQRRRLQLVDLSDDEMAKLHVRYMVGGVRHIRCRNASTASNSRNHRAAAALPQHAGYALEHFFVPLCSHGTDYGRVLAAFELGDHERISKPG